MSSSLREFLRDWQASQAFNREVPEGPQLANVAERVKRDLGEVSPKPPDDYSLEETYQAFRSILWSPEAVQHLAPKHIRRAPWVLFHAQEGDTQPLAANADLLHAYLDRVHAAATARTVTTLAFCFLYFYPSRYRSFEPVRRALQELIGRVQSPRARRLRKCDEEMGLFRQEGPETLAARVLESGRSPITLLADSCLSGSLGAHGFGREGFVRAIAQIQNQLAGGDWSERHLDQLMVWALDESSSQGALRFPGLRTELAEGLLLPFIQGSPGPEAQPSIQHFLLNHYGDPRLSSAMWQGVNEEAVGVMYRWLVQATLEDFFCFLDHVASFDREADRHWTYRRAFWKAYLQAGMIEEAWVAFGPDARREARRRLKDMDQNYAELQAGSRVKANHAVLLLRIGGLVVTEWSHMGKYRVWHPGNEHMPPFYRSRYRRDQLVWHPDFEGSHQSSETGNWQQKLSRHIRQQTNFSLPLRELMPR